MFIDKLLDKLRIWQHSFEGLSHVTCVSADVLGKAELIANMLKLLDKLPPTECPKVGSRREAVCCSVKSFYLHYSVKMYIGTGSVFYMEKEPKLASVINHESKHIMCNVKAP